MACALLAATLGRSTPPIFVCLAPALRFGVRARSALLVLNALFSFALLAVARAIPSPVARLVLLLCDQLAQQRCGARVPPSAGWPLCVWWVVRRVFFFFLREVVVVSSFVFPGFSGWPLARSAAAGVVGFCGPRFGPAAAAEEEVAAVVGSVLASGRAVAAGCAAGVDALVVSAAVAAGGGPRLFVFAAFGPSGLGALPGSSSLAGVSASVRAGASVSWWAGGAPGPVGSGRRVPPVVGRLVGRSLAFVRFCAASGPGSGLVGFVSSAPERPFAPAASGGWPSCGSGSWGSLGAAALLGLPVVVFPVGWVGFAGASSLPLLPGRAGSWVPAASSGVWAAGFRWMV